MPRTAEAERYYKNMCGGPEADRLTKQRLIELISMRYPCVPISDERAKKDDEEKKKYPSMTDQIVR